MIQFTTGSGAPSIGLSFSADTARPVFSMAAAALKAEAQTPGWRTRYCSGPWAKHVAAQLSSLSRGSVRPAASLLSYELTKP